MGTRLTARVAAAAISVAASALLLVTAAPSLAYRQTTAAPPIVTIRVTVTDAAITMKPKSATRGSATIFLFSNRTTRSHTVVIGDTERGPGKTIGFAAKLPPNGQHRVVMFLDYRGSLRYSTINAAKPSYKGIFRIT